MDNRPTAVPETPTRLLVAVAVVCVLSFIATIVVASRTAACAQAPFTPEQNATIASLDKIIDLGIKLSTTLVGFGVAALIGLRAEITLTPFTRLSIGIGTLLFAQSAFYAVWWRFGVAEAYLNECFIIASTKLQWRFAAHIYLFMFGLLSIVILVLSFLFRHTKSRVDT